MRRGAASSAIGRPRARALRGARGYTLIEMMTVISIIIILMSMMMYGLNRARITAQQEGSRAVVLQVKGALDAYYAEFGQYPPDGYDFPVRRTVGNQQKTIKGAQCLLHFLGTPMVKQVEVGQQTRLVKLKPFLELSSELLSGDGGADLEEKLKDPATEIVDKFGNGLHYDNVERDEKGEVHAAEQSDEHIEGSKGLVRAPDPRRPSGGSGGGPSGGGAGLQPKSKGTYDLWSHGHKIGDPSDDLTNWR